MHHRTGYQAQQNLEEDKLLKMLNLLKKALTMVATKVDWRCKKRCQDNYDRSALSIHCRVVITAFIAPGSKANFGCSYRSLFWAGWTSCDKQTSITRTKWYILSSKDRLFVVRCGHDDKAVRRIMQIARILSGKNNQRHLCDLTTMSSVINAHSNFLKGWRRTKV